MLKRSFAVIVLLLLPTAFLVAAVAITYTANVRPILVTYSCTECHGSFGAYTTIMAAVSEQPQTIGLKIVVASKPDSSVIIWRLNGQTPSGVMLNRMPKDQDQLPSAQITTISSWITQGAVKETPVIVVSPTWGKIKRLFRK